MALFKRSLLLIADGDSHYTLTFADTYRTPPFKYEVLVSMNRKEKGLVLKAPISLLGEECKGYSCLENSCMLVWTGKNIYAFLSTLALPIYIYIYVYAKRISPAKGDLLNFVRVMTYQIGCSVGILQQC